MTGELKFSKEDLTNLIVACAQNKHGMTTYGRRVTFGIVLDGVEHRDVQPFATFEVRQ